MFENGDQDNNLFSQFQEVDFSKIYQIMIITLILLVIIGITIIIIIKLDISSITTIFSNRRKNPKDIYFLLSKKNSNSKLDEINKLYLGNNSNDIRDNRNKQPSRLIEVLCLPEWSDISTYDTELQRQEAYNKQKKQCSNLLQVVMKYTFLSVKLWFTVMDC